MNIRKIVEGRVQFPSDRAAKEFHSHIEGSALSTGERQGSSVEYDSSDTRRFVRNAILKKIKELNGKVSNVE
jgi:hypothetical protein|tara:strand:+ start:423 stop:638 length:216 start_codon:yes stop_codon:yes gene_type:complete